MKKQKDTPKIGVEARQKEQKNHILSYLFRTSDKSIPEISKELKITVPTTQALITELLEEKQIIETGVGDSSGGRKPILYGLNPKNRQLICVEVNLQFFKVGIFNFKMDNISGIRVVEKTLDGTKEYLESISNEVLKHIQSCNVSIETCVGAGFFFPGLINPETGKNHTHFPNLDGSISEILANALQIPVYIENNAAAMAYGEYLYGTEGICDKNMLTINLEEGIGMGLIFNGQIYHGQSGFAGELGHIEVVNNGPLCHCGKQGCLEQVCSGRALIGMVENGLKKGQETLLTSMVQLQENAYDIDVIIQAAHSGDQFAIDCFATMAEKLGKGITILLHILNPGTIVISGTLSAAGKYLLDPLQQAINRYAMSQISNDVSIYKSAIGEKAAMLGMASVVFEKQYNYQTAN